jgi:hypothetical protein
MRNDDLLVGVVRLGFLIAILAGMAAFAVTEHFPQLRLAPPPQHTLEPAPLALEMAA